jgi:hypothetical protein
MSQSFIFISEYLKIRSLLLENNTPSKRTTGLEGVPFYAKIDLGMSVVCVVKVALKLYCHK